MTRRNTGGRILACCLAALLLGCSFNGSRAEDGSAAADELCTAVTFAAEKIQGNLEENIPPDFDARRYLVMVREYAPRYYERIARYRLEVKPRTTYFLLVLRDPGSGRIVAFDYSCHSDCDSKRADAPAAYDLGDLERHNPCEAK